MTEAWQGLLASTLRTKQGREEPAHQVLQGKAVTGLYFSAQWCAPCREFTPVLAAKYADVKAAHPDEFEVVYISSDRSDADYNAMCDKMPFPSVPLADADDLKTNLQDQYKVRWLPALVFVNGQGDVLEQDGRRLVVSASSAEAIWNALH